MAKSKKQDEEYCSKHHKLSSFGPTKPPKDPPRRKKQAHTTEWKNALCPVCMEFPHNAVLLLCSSHDKGCRPYICSTSRRHSNCLEQYKNRGSPPTTNPEASTDLSCPLCRGPVKGWAVVVPARRHLDGKRRSCTKDGCPFRGNYQELRRHAKAEHPLARPREVDPALAARWESFESERAIEDVITTIRSTMPGTVIVGDYVIERGHDSGLGSGGGHLHGDWPRPPSGLRVGLDSERRRGRLRGLADSQAR